MRSAASGRRRFVWVLVGILTLCTLARPVIPGLLTVLPLGDHVSVSNLQPEQGLAYTAKLGDPALSDHEKPTHAALYLIESRRGSVLNRLPAALGESFAFSWLRALFEVGLHKTHCRASRSLSCFAFSWPWRARSTCAWRECFPSSAPFGPASSWKMSDSLSSRAPGSDTPMGSNSGPKTRSIHSGFSTG